MSKLIRLIKVAPISDRLGTKGCLTYIFKCLKFVGWLPPTSGKTRYLYLFWACFAFFFSPIYLPIGLTLSLVKNLKNFTPREFFDVFQALLNVIGVTVRSIFLLQFIANIHETKMIFDKLDKQVQTDKDHRQIHKTVNRCNNFVLLYGILYVGYNLLVVIAKFLIGKPPWLVYNPFFNWHDGSGLFGVQVLIEYYLVHMMAIYVLIVDTYPLVFIIILRAHGAILKEQICNLRTDPLKTEQKNYENLVSCIKYHKLILDGCHLLKPIAERTFFVQFLLIGIELGIGLINVIYFTDVYNGAASTVLFMAVLVETFPFCYSCDYLNTDFEELSNLLGQSHWIGAERKYKTTLAIFMHHLQQPVIFNAGGIFPISMKTNIQVAKFAFSVLTLVQKTHLVDRFK